MTKHRLDVDELKHFPFPAALMEVIKAVIELQERADADLQEQKGLAGGAAK